VGGDDDVVAEVDERAGGVGADHAEPAGDKDHRIMPADRPESSKSGTSSNLRPAWRPVLNETRTTGGEEGLVGGGVLMAAGAPVDVAAEELARGAAGQA
jgi:hypothetical protein